MLIADPMEDRIKLFLAFAGAVGILWAFLRWMLRMQPRRQVFEILREERENTDAVIFEALDRSPRNRDTFRRYTERVFADVIAAQVQTADTCSETKDRIVYIEESLKAVQRSVMDNLTSAMNNNSRSTDSIAATMKEMQREIQRISDEQIRLAAVVQWDGRERRRRDT